MDGMRALLSTAVLCFVSCLSVAQNINTIVGTGGGIVDTGDGNQATAASTYAPSCLAIDKLGNLYIGETGGLKVRVVNHIGIITSIAGTGLSGYVGDGGPATDARFKNIHGICIDDTGNVIIADLDNNRVRKIWVSSGIITTIVGNGTAGFSGDGGPATNAQLNGPVDVCVDKKGCLYIADQNNARVRKVDKTGIITTAVGYGLPPYVFAGDGGYANITAIRSARGLCFDDTGNLFICDGHSRVMKVDTFGIIRTYAGNGISAVIGEGVPATAASTSAIKVCIDINNNLYLSEWVGGHKVRKVSNDGIISTVAGTGSPGFSGDAGPAIAAKLYAPAGVVVDTCENLIIADTWNNRVRKVLFYPECPDTSGGGEGPTQVVGELPKNEVSIFPNPVADVLHVTAANSANYSILGISGKTIASGNLSKGDNTIPVGHFPSGVYFITTTSPSGVRRVYKVVKE